MRGKIRKSELIWADKSYFHLIKQAEKVDHRITAPHFTQRSAEFINANYDKFAPILFNRKRRRQL